MTELTEDTLKAAKQHLRNNFNKGTDCPCCGQFVKLYKRKLNSGMAYALLNIYRHHRQDQVNVKDFLRINKLPNNHDWTLLKYWKILEEVEGDIPEEKKSNGIWKITDFGVEFLFGRVKVPSHVHLFNNKYQGHSDKEITIKEAFGNKFNYTELMQTIY